MKIILMVFAKKKKKERKRVDQIDHFGPENDASL